ncbi:MAG: N-acetylneuraminate synthase family protein [Bacteriovoracales bacterium]|nr:N-acetylneuraminate synthase family protein [Bacteriovoracales bacterium]
MKSYVIAEIGCNHKGDVEIAKKLIETAKEYCQANAVKFQKRCSQELLTEKEYRSPHPIPENSYGKTYGEHREFLEFSLETHRELMKFCQELEIEYSTSVWDTTSAKEIASLNPKFIKIPSACNLNKPLLMELIDHYSGDIHLSLGMTSSDEQEKIVDLFEQHKRGKDLVLYACTSGYPVAFEDICLLEIPKLIDKFGKRVKAIGFSGHHLGIAPDIAAMTLGATYIERHYTLDRTWKGTDHAASLEPDGLRKLCRNIRDVSKSLHEKPCEILDIEQVQREKLKRNSIQW